MPKCDVCLQDVPLFAGGPTDFALVVQATTGKDRKMVITHQELKTIPQLVEKAHSNNPIAGIDQQMWLMAVEATHGQSNWLLCSECSRLVPASLAVEAAHRFVRFSMTQPKTATKPASKANSDASTDKAAPAAKGCAGAVLLCFVGVAAIGWRILV